MSKRGRPAKYPWDELEVGQRFACDAKFASARVMASQQGKKLGKKFKVMIEWEPAPEVKGTAEDHFGQVEYVYVERVA